jgi:hypothetical protein
MEAQIKKLKLAVLSIGILSLFSCTAGVNRGSAFLNTSILNPSFEKMTDHGKKEGKNFQTNEVIKGAVIPFFFGTVEATLR